MPCVVRPFLKRCGCVLLAAAFLAPCCPAACDAGPSMDEAEAAPAGAAKEFHRGAQGDARLDEAGGAPMEEAGGFLREVVQKYARSAG